jgi:hypothetical protein
MKRAGKAVGLFLGGVLGAAAGAAPPGVGDLAPNPPQSPAPQMPMGPMAPSTTAGPARVGLADVLHPNYREAVLAVIRKPTISTRGVSEDVACDPAVYEWLLDHPDRVSLAWHRLRVPCVQIADGGNGRFVWTDPDGSEVVWQTVGRFPDGVVWYATGKVKASAVTPTVPVRVVVIVTYPRKALPTGGTAVSPVVQAYLHTDSRAASTVMRVLGPTAPKLAEQSAEQLLFFFSGIARYTHAHPEKAEELLAPPKK